MLFLLRDTLEQKNYKNSITCCLPIVKICNCCIATRQLGDTENSDFFGLPAKNMVEVFSAEKVSNHKRIQKEKTMYVGRIMHTDLVTATPDVLIEEAKNLIADKKIDHLLVVDKEKGNLMGIVSDRDIKQNWASPATSLSTHELNYLLSKITVGMIMVKKIVTVTPGTTIERAAYMMHEHDISALPVLDGDERLVGIITTTDVMEVIMEAIGIDDDSSRFSIMVDDRIGVLAQVTDILKENRINIRSVFSWPDRNFPGYYHLVLRVAGTNRERAVQSLLDGGFKVITDYVEDITPYLPEP